MVGSLKDAMRFRLVLPGLELASAHFVDHRFSPHRHDTYAIGLTMSGVQSFGYCGTVRHSLPGNAFVLHPDEMHDGRSGTEAGYSYRIAYLSPQLIIEAGQLAHLPFVRGGVSCSPRLGNAIAAVLGLGDAATDDQQQADALSGLADALIAHSDVPKRCLDKVDLRVMRRVRDHIMDSVPRRISSASFEAEHGMDRFTLARRFRQLYGVSPTQFATLRKLDLALAGIRTGRGLADVALSAGFADQSHMTRAFRRAFGLSPGQWRKLQS